MKLQLPIFANARLARLSLAPSSLAFFCLACPPLHAAPKLPQVEEPALRAHLALLSSDLFEGRGTGQRGGELTMAYLETQVAALGLQGANGKGFRQAVQITGIVPLPAQSNVNLVAGGKGLEFHFGDDWIWRTNAPQDKHRFDQQLVFAGYGITAAEEHWDDFKGQDVKGKILLVLPNDPQPTSDEPQRFGGKAITYYGRRDYKYEEAIRRGAIGVIVIHNDTLSLRSWASVTRHGNEEHFQLPESGLPFCANMNEAAARKLFAASGQDFDALRAKAERRDFVATPLQASLQGELASKIRQIEQFNIAAVVPGTAPGLKQELVIYSAHWDHLGRQPGEQPGKDLIYNGAVDNASGSAALLAMAKVAVTRPAKRSQMFLWVAAEEQGLLGSEYYSLHPLWPAAKTAANLNLDTLNFVAPTRDVGIDGAQRSDLAAIATKVAREMQLSIAPAQPDIQGYYFRSDHFSFAKAGIPAFSVGSGSHYVQNQKENLEKEHGYGKRYHQVSDKYDPNWDLSGMLQQAQFTLNLGRAIADAPTMPQWKAGDPFGKKRKQ
jgi:Zn-dependent M28 family amino/carboxypeptidase